MGDLVVTKLGGVAQDINLVVTNLTGVAVPIPTANLVLTKLTGVGVSSAVNLVLTKFTGTGSALVQQWVAWDGAQFTPTMVAAYDGSQFVLSR